MLTRWSRKGPVGSNPTPTATLSTSMKKEHYLVTYWRLVGEETVEKFRANLEKELRKRKPTGDGTCLENRRALTGP